jgi:hypothetical protein
MVSGSISLRCSRFFSPFLHSTSSLSVSQKYLALPDGAGGFPQGVSDLAVLRILLCSAFNSCTGLSPSMIQLSRRFHFKNTVNIVVLQPHNCRNNYGLGYSPFARHYLGNHLIVFFSSGYLDVSVLRVSILSDNSSSNYWVAPFGNLRVRIFAPNRSLSQLITSFIAFESQGIRHTPLITFLLIITCILLDN